MSYQQFLWKKLSLEPPNPSKPSSHPKNLLNQSIQLSHLQIKSNHLLQQIFSPTFHKIPEINPSKLNDSSSNFQLWQQNIQPATPPQHPQNNPNFQTPPPNPSQQNQHYHPNLIKQIKTTLNTIQQFLTHYQTNIKQIINNVKNYQNYFNLQLISLSHYINFIIKHQSEKYQKKQQLFHQQINLISYQNQLLSQKYQLILKKSHTFQSQISSLLILINNQKLTHQTLNQKYLQLTQLYKTKLQQNSSLLHHKLVLQSQLTKLTKLTQPPQLLSLSQSKNNLHQPNQYPHDDFQTQQHFRHQFSPTSSHHHHHFFNSLRTTSPNTKIKYQNSNITQSISFYSLKSNNRIPKSTNKPKRKLNKTNNSLKQNTFIRSKHPKQRDNISPKSKNSLTNQQSQIKLIIQQSTILQSKPQSILSNTSQQKIKTNQYDKQQLITRINQLKNQITQEIKFLKMEIN